MGLKSLNDGEIEFKSEWRKKLQRNLQLGIQQGLLFEKSKEKDKFKASKPHKSIMKASKSQSDNKF